VHYSKGPFAAGRIWVIAQRAGAGLALVAAALLVVAEFTTVFEVTVGSLEVVRRSSTGGDNHGYALVVIAVLAFAMTPLALGGARPPALALVALGGAALAIALIVDLPDTRASGGLPESLAYELAQARAGPGLGLEIAGGVLLLAAGLLLAFANRPTSREATVPPC
jgi:hypothetical protein